MDSSEGIEKTQAALGTISVIKSAVASECCTLSAKTSLLSLDGYTSGYTSSSFSLLIFAQNILIN